MLLSAELLPVMVFFHASVEGNVMIPTPSNTKQKPSPKPQTSNLLPLHFPVLKTECCLATYPECNFKIILLTMQRLVSAYFQLAKPTQHGLLEITKHKELPELLLSRVSVLSSL